MRKSSAALACMVLAGIFGLSSPAWAQQRTVKACQEEWRADKAANQAKGSHRAIQRLGAITSQPVLGGLQHQYCRI